MCVALPVNHPLADQKELRPHDIVMVMGNLKDIYEVFEQPPKKEETGSIYGKNK